MQGADHVKACKQAMNEIIYGFIGALLGSLVGSGLFRWYFHKKDIDMWGY